MGNMHLRLEAVRIQYGLNIKCAEKYCDVVILLFQRQWIYLGSEMVTNTA